jgi:hypothetical protein
VIPDDYYIIWFDQGAVFTLVDAESNFVTVGLREVESDGYEVLLTPDAVSAARQTNGTRFAITGEALSLFVGVYV